MGCSLWDAPRGKQTPAGAPRAQRHRQQSPVLPLCPAPIHMAMSVPFWQVRETKPGRELAVPSRWGRPPQGCEPLHSLGSDGVKIKAMCVAWAKVYGNKQLPELRDGSGNDLMYYAASWGESMAELSRVQRPPQNLLTAMVRYLCLNCLLDTMPQTRNDLFSLLGSKTRMVISPPL